MSYSFIPEPILRIYGPLYRRYFKSRVWLQYGRHHDAPLRPFHLLSIAPDQINHVPEKKIGSTFECSIRGGTWDCELNPLEENLFYRSFKTHIERGIDWRETDYYPAVLKKVRSGKGWKNCSNQTEVLEKLETYDRLYEHIAEYGYKTQRALRLGEPDGEYELDIKYYPPEFDEITVDVGRDGTLIWHSGLHRLTIARLLEIESVPVRIRVRHAEWQQTRDTVWNDPRRSAAAHPDLTNK